MARANRVRAVAGLPRPLEPSDAEELYALVEANRAYLSRWMPWAPSSTPVAIREFIAMGRRQLAENNGFHAALERDGRIVGVAGFHSIDWLHRSTSIGYWLAEAENWLRLSRGPIHLKGTGGQDDPLEQFLARMEKRPDPN